MAHEKAHKLDQGLASRISVDQLAALLGLWNTGPGPLYHQLSAAIGTLVETGRLRHGVLLPPERSLASTLTVSRGTVVSAYTRLAEQGLVARRRGSGTRVTSAPQAPPGSADRVGDRLLEVHADAIDLLMAMPRMLPRVLETVSAVDLGEHASLLDEVDAAGLMPVRRRVAELVTVEGLPTTADQILITSGAQQALSLAIRLLVGPGDVVACEEATWPGLIDTVTGVGGRIRPVRVDQDGVILSDLRQALVHDRPVAVALSPYHHNPTGSFLPAGRRSQLLALVDEFEVALVEDRVMARLGIEAGDPRPLLADATPAAAARGVVVDSLSKVSWPGLRAGWIRANAQAIDEFRRLRFMLDLYSAIHSQLALVGVIDRLDLIMADRADQLRRGRDVLLAAVRETLPEWRVRKPRGGLVLWAELPEPMAEEFCGHAARHGVLVASGRQFGLTDNRHVRLPFTTTEPQLLQAVHRLGTAWSSFEPAPVPAGHRPFAL
ncbi:MAG: PLP-dependent aminotransferase family protein [Acidimicrobiales bacterium]